LLAVDSETRHHHPNEANDLADHVSLEGYFTHFVLENQDHMTETELAKKLGISRKALWQRRQKLSMPRERSRRS